MRIVKVTVNLPEEMASALREEAVATGVSFTQLLKEAIGLKFFFDGVRAEGGRLVVEGPGRRSREIVFGYWPQTATDLKEERKR